MHADVHALLARVARAHAAGRRLDLAALIAASESRAGPLLAVGFDPDPDMEDMLADAERRSAAR